MAEHELNKIVDDDGEVFNLRDSTKQPVADRVTSWSSTPSDTKYPSEKLVKDSLDGKEDKSNKVTSVRAASSATDTAYPSEKAVATALSEKASKQVRLSFTLAAAPSGGVSTKYVKIYAAGSDYRHWECSYNGTTGSLYAAWLFRSYATGENSRDNVTLLKSIDTVARAWYSVGASTWYVKFEHASTSSQQMTFNVAALDTSALPTLEAVDTLPSGATELTVNGVTMAEKLVTARQLAVDLSNTSTNTSFNGTANVTNIKVSGQLADTNIASASNWNAKEDASNKVTSVRASGSASDTKYPSEKAVAAAIETTVGDYRTKPQDISKGANLVVNGSGRMASNYNFSTCTYLPTISTNGSAGSFGFNGNRWSDEFISCDFTKRILVSADVRDLIAQESTVTHRIAIREYDIDKQDIYAYFVMFTPGTLTTLAADLNPGDTVVKLTSVTNWTNDIGQTYKRGFIFWDYTNSYGYTYPPETYSRYMYSNYFDSASDVNASSNTIALNKAWAERAIPAGTPVSKSDSGNTYPYPATISIAATDLAWHSMSGYMTGVTAPGVGSRSSTKFSQGTAFIKIGLVPSNLTVTDTVTGNRAAIANWYMYELPDSAPKLTTARQLAVDLANTSTTTTFDGSANVTNIKVSGTLPIANGGTGQTTANNAANALLMGLPTWTADPSDNVYLIRRDTAGSAAFGQVKFSTVWNYVKGKMSSDSGVNISGSASSATSATNVNITGSVKTTSTTNGDTIQMQAGTGTAGEVTIVNSKHSASSAKLDSAKELAVSLSNTSTTTTFDGSAAVTNIKVSGTLPVANGGTGATTAANARTNLDVYSKSETDSLLNGKVEVVTALPATGTSGVIYYVGPTGSGSDQYEEYIWDSTNSQFIKVGDKSVDLSNYVNTLSASGTGSVVTSISKSGNTLSATIGNIAIDNLSDWASKTDVTVSSVTYHTYWPVAPTSSNQVYGISIKDGKLYQVYNNKGTYSVRPYDRDTTYTNAGLGQGYGTCSTAESTAEKAVTLGSYAQTAGGIVAVKFTNAICAAATLKVNGTTAKPIYIKGAAVTAGNKGAIAAGDTAYFMYDGTQYQFICTDRISKEGITGLSVSGRTVTYTKADGTTGTITTQDTTYTFDGTYNASTNKAATVSTVTNAVNALDVDDITGFGAGKTLATLTETDGKIAATFQDISITSSQISDKTDSYSASGTVAVTGKAVAAALGTLDVSSVGGAGKYISAISETDGKISATATTMDTTPTASSTNAVTSGGIKTALDAKAPNAVTTEAAIATGDKLLFSDASDSSNTKRMNTGFDTGVTNTMLRKDGTFARALYADEGWGGTFGNALAPMDTYLLQQRNCFFGAKPSAIKVEYSTDGGSTWIDYGINDEQKQNLFSQYAGTSVACGKHTHILPTYTGSIVGTKDLSNDNVANQRLRITICCRSLATEGTTATTDKWLYGTIRRVGIYMSTNSASKGPRHCVFTAKKREDFNAGNDTWTNFGDYAISGDSGWNSIPCSNKATSNGITFGDSFNGQYAVFRFEVWSEGVNDSPAPSQTGNMIVTKIVAFTELCWQNSSSNTNLANYGMPCTVNASTGNAHFPKGITSGVAIPVSSGGTGATTAKGASYNINAGMNSGDSDAIVDTSRFAFNYSSPSATSGGLYYRTAPKVWDWIKGKISSVLGLTETSYGGNAATATSAGKLTTARKTYVTLGTASTTTTRDWSGDTTIPVDGTLAVSHGGTGLTSVTSNSFLVGNGTSALVEKTPSEVLSLIGGQAALTEMTTQEVTDFVAALGEL